MDTVGEAVADVTGDADGDNGGNGVGHLVDEAIGDMDDGAVDDDGIVTLVVDLHARRGS